MRKPAPDATGAHHRDRHHHYQQRAHVIHPGGWHVAAERPIATLLGSCVAVCLYDETLGLGGMNHFLLPEMRNRTHARADRELAGDYAMEVLVNAMLKRGARKTRLVAKAFGGGNIANLKHFEVGSRNADFARHWLQQEGIPLLASDFGGPYTRQVVLLPENGEALCKRTVNQLPERVRALAADHACARKRPPRQKDIELF